MKALQEIRSREKTENTAVDYFINLDSETLSQSTFVADLADFLTANRYMASRLIFEMSQNDYITIKANLREVFASLSQLGCRFAMGDIFDFSLDSKMLKKNMISFVKIESDHLRRYLNRPDGKMTVLSLKKELDINGIDLVACQINSEEELLGLEALNVDFGQGQLFYSKSKPNERAA